MTDMSETLTIHRGPAWSFRRQLGDFYVLDNHAMMGGAYMGKESLYDFALSLAKHVALKPEDLISPEEVDAADPEEQDELPLKRRFRSYADLTEQGRKLFQHIRRTGSISAREAMNDYGITSATLARRMCDIEEAGYTVVRERRVHPITGKRYTRYSLSN